MPEVTAITKEEKRKIFQEDMQLIVRGFSWKKDLILPVGKAQQWLVDGEDGTESARFWWILQPQVQVWWPYRYSGWTSSPAGGRKSVARGTERRGTLCFERLTYSPSSLDWEEDEFFDDQQQFCSQCLMISNSFTAHHPNIPSEDGMWRMTLTNKTHQVEIYSTSFSNFLISPTPPAKNILEAPGAPNPAGGDEVGDNGSLGQTTVISFLFFPINLY